MNDVVYIGKGAFEDKLIWWVWWCGGGSGECLGVLMVLAARIEPFNVYL